MPWSSEDGKHYTREVVQRIATELRALSNSMTVLDVGPGAGAYGRLVAEMSPRPTIDAVEVHAPYVERFGLKALYRHVFVADARDFLHEANNFTMTKGPRWDVVIMGDVLEHMPKDDAVQLWENARLVAKHSVIASIPLGEYPQGACEGNAFEEHVTTWQQGEAVADLPGITNFYEGPEIGVYIGRSARDA